MNNTIFVNYDPFATESRISVYKDDQHEWVSFSAELNELAEAVVALSYDHGIYETKIHAPFAITSEVRRLVAENENKVYSQNKINVEGI